jgi:hypothetical protein
MAVNIFSRLEDIEVLYMIKKVTDAPIITTCKAKIHDKN